MPMDISQRIIISYAEYQRLLKSEKQYNHYREHRSSVKKEAPEEAPAASDLVGGGAVGGGSSGHSRQHPVGPPADFPLSFSSFEHPLPNNGPVAINTNCKPPPEDPLVNYRLFTDNTDRIRQEAARDKTLPPSMPMNDPLGVRDPSLPQGHAPVRPFVANQQQRNADNSVSLGRPPTAQEVAAAAAAEEKSHPWYYLGPEDLASSSEDDDGMDDL